VSVEPTRVTQRHFDYLAERTTPEDAFLAALRAAARAAGLPSIHIGPAQGAFLEILVRAVRAREVVEVGTLGGYSAVWLARGLPEGGRVRTIEAHPGHAAFAREWIARSDVAGRVEVIEGRGQDVLPRLPDASVDLAFLDADKAGYGAYLESCARILKPGGVVAADNAFAFGQLFDEHPTDREVPAVRDFNDRLARDARFRAVIVPLGDGCWVGVRTG
jgi:predicted O-methyltransferase YrrM